MTYIETDDKTSTNVRKKYHLYCFMIIKLYHNSFKTAGEREF